MKPTEAEQLLGGHATGTLTETERSRLFAAALEHQKIFDALLDEEALRELLADPVAKAQLLAALAAPATPKIVPFWRRAGVLGAAASLLVAATAGLAYLRSPNALPSVARPVTLQEPAAKAAATTAAKAVAASPAAQAPVAPLQRSASTPPAQAPVAPLQRSASTPPAQSADQRRQEALAPALTADQKVAASVAGAVAPVAEDSARLKEKAEFRRAEAQDQLAKKAEARPAAAAVLEVVAAHRGDAPERRATAKDRAAGGVPAGVSGGIIGGVVGGVVSGVAPASPSAAKAKAAGGLATNAAASVSAPTWVLEAQPDGSTRVTVTAPRGRPVVLLQRGSAGVEALPIQVFGDRGQALLRWRVDVRLGAGDALDLYLLNAPVAEPSKLPETGPVDGFRARIHPVAGD